jgi:hypothetical protein
VTAHEQCGYQGDQTKDLIHRHSSTCGKADEADQERQPELTPAETDQTSDAADHQRTSKGYCDC